MSDSPRQLIGSVTFAPRGPFRPPKVEVKGRAGPKFTLPGPPERKNTTKSDENATNLAIFGILTSIFDLLSGQQDGLELLKAEIDALRKGLEEK
jgi:hypothetical protein